MARFNFSISFIYFWSGGVPSWANFLDGDIDEAYSEVSQIFSLIKLLKLVFSGLLSFWFNNGYTYAFVVRVESFLVQRKGDNWSFY